MRLRASCIRLVRIMPRMGGSRVQLWLDKSFCYEELRSLRDRLGIVGAIGMLEPLALADLDLPNWVSKVEVVAPLRALASCYGRSGDAQYVPFALPTRGSSDHYIRRLALTTLLVALPILLGPSPEDAPSENICLGTHFAPLTSLVADVSPLLSRGGPDEFGSRDSLERTSDARSPPAGREIRITGRRTHRA